MARPAAAQCHIDAGPGTRSAARTSAISKATDPAQSSAVAPGRCRRSHCATPASRVPRLTFITASSSTATLVAHRSLGGHLRKVAETCLSSRFPSTLVAKLTPLLGTGCPVGRNCRRRLPACALPRPGGPMDDGRQDFDFVHGRWDVHNRRLRDPLDPGCTVWDQFPTRSAAEPILGGLGNVDRYWCDGTDAMPAFEGFTLRLFDPQTRLWRIWWSSTRQAGRLDPPVEGAFTEGIG